MAKDSKGHGSEKRGVVGPSNRTAIGHFLKALQGIHRTVPGHPGIVPTGQGVPPVVRHNMVRSAGTDANGGSFENPGNAKATQMALLAQYNK